MAKLETNEYAWVLPMRGQRNWLGRTEPSFEAAGPDLRLKFRRSGLHVIAIGCPQMGATEPRPLRDSSGNEVATNPSALRHSPMCERPGIWNSSLEQYSAGGEVDGQHQITALEDPTNWAPAPHSLREASEEGVASSEEGNRQVGSRRTGNPRRCREAARWFSIEPSSEAWLPGRFTTEQECGVDTGPAVRGERIQEDGKIWTPACAQGLLERSRLLAAWR